MSPSSDPPTNPPQAHPKAYENLDFLQSVDARSIRVIAELIEPQFRLQKHGITDTIVFFGSARAPAPSRDHPDPHVASLAGYYEAARTLSHRLTLWSKQRPAGRRFVIASGAGPGIMEAVNRGASEAGGGSIGFGIDIPQEPVLNEYVTPELSFLFHYFFMRKFWFVYNAKAFVFLPGGYGTIDELMEVLTLVQTGRLHKKVGILLFGTEFWRSVLNFEAMVEHGVISAADVKLFHVTDDLDDAMHHLQSFLDENYGPSLLEDAPDIWPQP